MLVILDGFGERQERDDNAVRLAKTPVLDALYRDYPHGLIGTSGPDVGLPPGQMGNSEVGHLNFGAGRIAMMDISRIDRSVYEKSLGDNAVIRSLLEQVRGAREQGGRLHLFGLVSDGGVHSSLEHLKALIDLAEASDVSVVVHAFLDGRDVQPGTAPTYLAQIEEKLAGAGGARRGIIGTVSGRYWAMDRDNRWDRVERAYRAIVSGDAPRFASAHEGVQASYAAKKTDEFVEPIVIGDYVGVRPGDVGLHFNFRPDRARELTRALATADFREFERGAQPFTHYACMTTYDSKLGLPIAFPKETYPDIFPEVLARAGLTQFRCAETEKYAHVTYFFNGGREEPFQGEERAMIPSPKDVPTYDHKPEMSAAGVAETVEKAIQSDKYDFILVNFANPDMVGHTGFLDAAIRAVETVDAGVGRIVDAARARGGAVLITADHGNCELMKDPATGEPHTAHTLNPVPLLYVNDRDRGARLREGGRICDVAPTMLELLGIAQPSAMTGVSLRGNGDGPPGAAG
ncbi:2,3-bisphosphoglycerate-independent phosphoglycerate mutase [Pendulispora albinea]|uniref:2,3-bisphosphoglycerate-independent phosphoglycerate mutase n=1 Tax=Pendulispora albinea TaxID=2741071 RepID=A0ABZ2LTX2_9BACT